MKARTITLLLAAYAVGMCSAWWWQWQRAAAWRAELPLLQDDHAEVARVRREHARLQATQVSEAERAALTADRAAVVRLRAEIDGLRRSVKAREIALTEQTARRVVPPTPKAMPDLVLRLDFSTKGLVIDGQAANIEQFRARLTAVSPGQMVELRVPGWKPNDQETFEAFKRRLGQISAVAREVAKQHGLKIALSLDRAD